MAHEPQASAAVDSGREALLKALAHVIAKIKPQSFRKVAKTSQGCMLDGTDLPRRAANHLDLAWRDMTRNRGALQTQRSSEF